MTNAEVLDDEAHASPARDATLALSDEAMWLAPRRGHDTVVFVHGILGNHTGTWGEFPALLGSDPELPSLDILRWGYRSGLRPSSYLDVAAEARGLMSNLALGVDDGESIAVVAHSMGGLVALEAIVGSIRQGNGTRHPSAAIELVTLYATPLEGASAADCLHGLIERCWLIRTIARLLPNRQLRDLRREGFVTNLLSDVERYVQLEGADAANDLSQHRLAVQVVLAKRDRVVSAVSATGPFAQHDPPLVLEGDHQSIKLPDHLSSDRYLATKRNLVKRLARRLNALCRAALDTTADRVDRVAAVERVVAQYECQFAACHLGCYGVRHVSNSDRRDVLLRFLQIGAVRPLAPEALVRAVIADVRIGDDLPAAPVP